jgi:hypothetical protein
MFRYKLFAMKILRVVQYVMEIKIIPTVGNAKNDTFDT